MRAHLIAVKKFHSKQTTPQFARSRGKQMEQETLGQSVLAMMRTYCNSDYVLRSDTAQRLEEQKENEWWCFCQSSTSGWFPEKTGSSAIRRRKDAGNCDPKSESFVSKTLCCVGALGNNLPTYEDTRPTGAGGANPPKNRVPTSSALIVRGVSDCTPVVTAVKQGGAGGRIVAVGLGLSERWENGGWDNTRVRVRTVGNLAIEGSLGESFQLFSTNPTMFPTVEIYEEHCVIPPLKMDLYS
ncbi:hypothetical protein BGY98DRAFT_936118 [Russula aff. rugulosa BPL654]|nr:hypothetical protein BGY98DRAFT_936118 [Russula aff. rugulosa BPL654]